ncbi:MAG: sigma-54 dependent transcriptional regulator [Amphritea sp.]|nr:sigma-54 dependent transcriptional regulator [Amphritea sp.]
MNLPETRFKDRPVVYVRAHEDAQLLDRKEFCQGWEVTESNGLLNAQQTIGAQKFNVGLIHLERYGKQDVRDVEQFLNEYRSIEWVAITSNDCLKQKHVCKLIRNACYDYFTLPLNQHGFHRLHATLGHAYGMAALDLDEFEPDYDDYEMVGASPSMLKLFDSIRKIASVDAAVLVAGESGTGKELIARAIHERSGRSEGPFVAVNCGAIPDTLINSELFGHEKGAFTGAHQLKIGQIEAATGGTLFLDEIGDLPLEQQVNMLRFLQEQVIQRVGSNEAIPVDVRVLAATHVDLDKAVAEGHFREDLLYRLNVLHISTPALRDREGDIELMARYFFERFRGDGGKRLRGFSQSALQALEQHDWPGNVRELINRIRRAIVMCEGRLINPEDLGLNTMQIAVPSRVMSLEDARIEAEKRAIEMAMRFSKQNMTQAAKSLGVSRVTLYRLMEKHHLQ